MITRATPLKADSVRVVEVAIKVSPSGDDTIISVSGKYILLEAASGEIYGSGSFNQPGRDTEASLRQSVELLEAELANIFFRGSPTTTTTPGIEAVENTPVDDVPGL